MRGVKLSAGDTPLSETVKGREEEERKDMDGAKTDRYRQVDWWTDISKQTYM